MGEARRKEARRREASPDAERLFQFLSVFAQDQFLRTGEVKAMFDGVRADGERVIIPAPWGDDREKDLILEAVRIAFRGLGVVRYGMLSEVWMARYDGKDAKRDPDVMPRDRDDRIEAVIVAVVEPPVVLFGRRVIIRPWDGGRPHLGPLERNPNGMDRFEGRMMELLDD